MRSFDEAAIAKAKKIWGKSPLQEGATIVGLTEMWGIEHAIILLVDGKYVTGKSGAIGGLPGRQPNLAAKVTTVNISRDVYDELCHFCDSRGLIKRVAVEHAIKRYLKEETEK